MFRCHFSAVLFVPALLTLPVTAQTLHISGENIRAHVKYLSSDELEGRGVGTSRREAGNRVSSEPVGQQQGLNPAVRMAPIFRKFRSLAPPRYPTRR